MLDKIINEMIYLSKLLSKNKIKIILLFALFFGIPNHSNAQKKVILKQSLLVRMKEIMGKSMIILQLDI